MSAEQRPTWWTDEEEQELLMDDAARGAIERIAATKREEKRMRGAPEQRKGIRMVVFPKRARCLKSEEAAKAHEWLLPFHLILGRLPVRQFFQLPCVCKHWDSMLRAGEVLIDMKTAGEEYWFVFSKPPLRDQRGWDFMACSSHSSSLQRNFFRLPLPSQSQSHSKLSSLLGGMHCTLLANGMRYTLWANSTSPCLVSAGGLMCAFVHKSGAPYACHVIVFNILTGSVKVLPPVLDWCYFFGSIESRLYNCNIYMGFDNQDTARYYIVLMRADTLQVPDYFEVFDSRSGHWKVGQNPESATANFKVVDGDFFYLDHKRSTLFAYQAAGDVWSKVHVSSIRNGTFGMWPTFLKYKGRLLLGLHLMEGICLGFVVFELQPATAETATWVEVARTPMHLWQWISSRNCQIKSEGGLFYMKIGDDNMQGHFRPPLVYDVAQNSWYILPSHSNLDCIFVHRPRLSMRMPYLTDGEESDERSHAM